MLSLTSWAFLALGDASAQPTMLQRASADIALLQRMDRLEARVTQTEAENAKLQGRVATLEAENAELKLHSNKEKVATDTIGVSVDASGAARRRLSHTAADGCCRWSADGVCGANVTQGCTMLHEYAESKIATVMFEDVDSCPGANPSAGFDPLTAEVILKAGGSEVTRVKTPLKVTHSSDCNDEATLTVQLDTEVDGALVAGASTLASATVTGDADVNGSLTVGGVDVLASVQAVERQLGGSTVWNMTGIDYAGFAMMKTSTANSWTDGYMISTEAVSRVAFQVPVETVSGHTSVCFTNDIDGDQTSCATGGGLVIPHALLDNGDPNPYPVTILCQGSDYLSGSSDLPDATHYGSAGEYFVVEHSGTTISIKEGATNIYDCTVPAGAYYAYVWIYTGGQVNTPPSVTWA